VKKGEVTFALFLCPLHCRTRSGSSGIV